VVAAARLKKRFIGFGQTLREVGLLDACLYALARVLESLSGRRVRVHKYYLVAQPVSKMPRLAPHRGQMFEVRQVAEFDPLIRQFPRPDWVIPYRFKQGAVCLAATKTGTVVGFLWLTLGPYDEDEVRCRYIPLPSEATAWDFDVYVEPAYRNGIVFGRLWDEANRFLTAHGVEWSLSRISAFNSGSILSHGRMGATRIGAATFLSMGRWQIAASTIAPHFHFSTGPGSFPTYRLDPGEPEKPE
jgi:hypothetical protein